VALLKILLSNMKKGCWVHDEPLKGRARLGRGGSAPGGARKGLKVEKAPRAGPREKRQTPGEQGEAPSLPQAGVTGPRKPGTKGEEGWFIGESHTYPVGRFPRGKPGNTTWKAPCHAVKGADGERRILKKKKIRSKTQSKGLEDIGESVTKKKRERHLDVREGGKKRRRSMPVD